MINRTVKAKNLPEYEETEEDRHFEREDQIYQERKDREYKGSDV
jgi:hypothetical protein